MTFLHVGPPVCTCFCLQTDTCNQRKEAIYCSNLIGLIYFINMSRGGAALQAATILVAMATEKKFWRPKF